jgi:hypothetical protein
MVELSEGQHIVTPVKIFMDSVRGQLYFIDFNHEVRIYDFYGHCVRRWSSCIAFELAKRSLLVIHDLVVHPGQDLVFVSTCCNGTLDDRVRIQSFRQDGSYVAEYLAPHSWCVWLYPPSRLILLSERNLLVVIAGEHHVAVYQIGNTLPILDTLIAPVVVRAFADTEHHSRIQLFFGVVFSIRLGSGVNANS